MTKIKNLLWTFFILALSPVALAHVKWFSNNSFLHEPLPLNALNQPAFWGLFALSLVSLPLLVWLDKTWDQSPLYLKVNSFFDRYGEHDTLIMRVTMGAVLLMSWQGDSMVAPDLPVSSPLWGWFQFGLALLLLFKETTPLTGVGMIFLYLLGLNQHGLFHMLDYVIYPSVGLFLILSSSKNITLKSFNLPVLYTGLGFSLCWVALEKLIYPYWGISVLAQAPELSMGLPHDFFLMSTAFVEFTLGYLLIICLLQRPMAIVITLVFFITTMFFGKLEVIGHTILHGALLVFIVKGPGHYYQAPIRFHRSVLFRNIFAMVNFALLFLLLIVPYENMSKQVYAKAVQEEMVTRHERFNVPADQPRPQVKLTATRDDHGGWNLNLATENFRFTPVPEHKNDILGEGHAHYYIDGKKMGRIYSEWFHLSLPRGTHRVKVTLNTNSHLDYYIDGEPIMSEVVIDEERDTKSEHQH